MLGTLRNYEKWLLVKLDKFPASCVPKVLFSAICLEISFILVNDNKNMGNIETSYQIFSDKKHKQTRPDNIQSTA